MKASESAMRGVKAVGRGVVRRLPVGARERIWWILAGKNRQEEQEKEVAALDAQLSELEDHLALRRSMRAPVGGCGLSEAEVRAEIAKVGDWYHRIQVAPGVFTPGVNDSDRALETMDLPDDLSGKRLLDIGARDGYFSFVAEDRGAEVLAMDSVAPNLTGFEVASKLMASEVEYRTMNVYDLSAESIGEFDAIFFLGVLYHLRDPMLALDRVWSVAKPGANVWIESHTIDHGLVDPTTGEHRHLAEVAPNLVDIPIAQFYPGTMLGETTTNWWAPNLAGLRAMVESAGFAVERSLAIGGRGLVIARKVRDHELEYFREYDRAVDTESSRDST